MKIFKRVVHNFRIVRELSGTLWIFQDNPIPRVGVTGIY